MSLEDGGILLTKALMKGPAIKNQLDKSNNLLKTREQFSLIEWGKNGPRGKKKAKGKFILAYINYFVGPFCVT